MKFVATSDLHGNLPIVPKCDVLLIAGDVTWESATFTERRYLNGPFYEWCETQDCQIIMVAGNHDRTLQTDPDLVRFAPNVIYLPSVGEGCFQQPSVIGESKITISGCPHTRQFYDWAFMMDEQDLEEHFKALGRSDIWIMHSPVFKHGDKTKAGESVGSPMLLEKIWDYEPMLVVTGHIHEDYGRWDIGETIVVNGSYVDEQYRPGRKMWEFELPG